MRTSDDQSPVKNEQGGEVAREDHNLAGVRVVVLVPPLCLDMVRSALAGARQLTIVDGLRQLRASDADLIVVAYQELEAAEDKEHRALLQQWRETPDPIRVVIDAPADAAVSLLTDAGVDLVVTVGVESEELRAAVGALLRRARWERERSPLTGLPGNRRLVHHLRRMLRQRHAVGVLLLDIDDFKSYNDQYGHLRGDKAITTLADAVECAAGGVEGAFAAHIGGDDFCIICAPEVLDTVASACLREFDHQAAALEGPAPTITGVATVVTPNECEALEDVFERLAALKRKGKLQPKSNYLRDGR